MPNDCDRLKVRHRLIESAALVRALSVSRRTLHTRFAHTLCKQANSLKAVATIPCISWNLKGNQSENRLKNQMENQLENRLENRMENLIDNQRFDRSDWFC